MYADITQHYEYMKIYNQERREFFKSRGICTNCGKESAFEGRTMCPECLDKVKEASERTRSEASKEQRKKYIAEKRKRCIEQGICRECLKRKATIGKICLECHLKAMRRKSTIDIRQLRKSLGLCVDCGEPVLEGYKTCKKHHDIRAAAFNNWSLNRDNSNHIWRKYTRDEIDRIKFWVEKKVHRLDEPISE